MTLSIHGLVSLTSAMAMTMPAHKPVTSTPVTHVKIDLRPVTSHCIGVSVVVGLLAFTLSPVDKELIREEIRGRGPIDPETQRLIVSGLFSWMAGRLPGTVSAFLAMPGEVDLSPLFERLPGWRWVLPRVEPGIRLSFRDKDVPREMHEFGMSQPSDQGEEIPIREIDIFLTPGLAFDNSGGRVGNGAGYYDRVLAQRRTDSLAVGVTVQDRVFDVVPTEAHDEGLDLLATEDGVRECSPTT